MAEWLVNGLEEDFKLLDFLKQKLGSSNRQVKWAIDKGYVQVNRKIERFATTKLKKGNLVSLREELLEGYAQQIKFEKGAILYEDSDLLIYNKPAGIAIEGSESLTSLLKSYTSNLEPVHRLDKETTGVIIYAKSKAALESLLAAFKGNQVKKSYLALVDGNVREERGRTENYLRKKKASASGYAYWEEAPHGLKAITNWEVIARGTKATLMRCFPETGRSHQIRLHMKKIGHPILGDIHYSTSFKSAYKPLRMQLHAESYTFHHPTKNEELSIKAPLPSDFMEACRNLELVF